jgi:polyadenylate-binding protein
MQAFEKPDNRSVNRTNIYLKNLPEMEEDKLTALLKTQLSSKGTITSILVKKDPQVQKPFAFVCFEKSADAEKAFQYLEETNMNLESKLYVNWAQTRFERNRKLKELYNTMQNETNLYLKNLKSTLTKEQVQQVFAEYGEITSCEVKMPANMPEYKPNLIPTKFAFINFRNKDDAKNVLPSYRH